MPVEIGLVPGLLRGIPPQPLKATAWRWEQAARADISGFSDVEANTVFTLHRERRSTEMSADAA